MSSLVSLSQLEASFHNFDGSVFAFKCVLLVRLSGFKRVTVKQDVSSSVLFTFNMLMFFLNQNTTNYQLFFFFFVFVFVFVFSSLLLKDVNGHRQKLRDGTNRLQ